MDMQYLTSDKRHVLEFGKKDSTLEKAMKYCQERTTKVLYRGLTKENLDRIDSGEPINDYLSFTELKKVAEGFARSYRSKRLIQLEIGSTAFPYYKAMLWQLEHRNPGGDPEADDENIEALLKEKEWILPFNAILVPVPGKTDTYRVQ